MRLLLGISGASGAPFAVDFLKRCPADEKYVILTRWGRSLLKTEADLSPEDLAPFANKIYANDDLSAPFASGSNPFDALVILPCSASTMSKIACGIGDTLLTRMAAVALKERRKLIIALRETPLSAIHLEQALRLSLAGAIVMPLSPPFYQKPQTIEEMIGHFNDKILSLIGHPTALAWKPELLE